MAAIVLGIDPGSRVTGYGLIAVEGQRPRYLASGCIRLGDAPLEQRLQTIFDALGELIAHHQPSAVAIEQVFVGKNATSALKLGHARGVALLAASIASLPVAEYTPRAIKQAVTASGAADKQQVQAMVVRLLQLSRKPASDAADALAIALCHAFTSAPLRAAKAAVAPL